jgi:hypothetical protein
MAFKTRDVAGGVAGRRYRISPGEALYGVKKGQFGLRRSRHGAKTKTTFNKLAYDFGAGKAVTVPRHTVRKRRLR